MTPGLQTQNDPHNHPPRCCCSPDDMGRGIIVCQACPEHGTTARDQYPREQYSAQAPIGAAPASLAASIALGRLLRMSPLADIASIRFEIVDPSPHPYAGPGPYVVCSAAEPDECPSCHTLAGQHPHTEYCRRLAEQEHAADLCRCAGLLGRTIPGPQHTAGCPMRIVADRPENHEYPGQPSQPAAVGQVSQPATRTSQPHTQIRGEAGPECFAPHCPDGERCKHPWHSQPVAVININDEAGPDLVDKVRQAIREAQRRNGRGN